MNLTNSFASKMLTSKQRNKPNQKKHKKTIPLAPLWGGVINQMKQKKVFHVLLGQMYSVNMFSCS